MGAQIRSLRGMGLPQYQPQRVQHQRRLEPLRIALDAIPIAHRNSAAAPAPTSNADSLTALAVLESPSSNVWGIPRPHLPALPRHQWRGLACFALALACLWYLDVLTTSWALNHGAIEVGPVAKFLVGHGMIPLMVAKIFGLFIIVGLAAMQLARKRETLAGWSLGAVGAISLGIVEWNLLGILLLAGVL